MAAIAEISTLKEWDEEWRCVEDDFQNFKQTKFVEYQKKMDEYHKSQKSCISMVNLIKRKIKDFVQSLARLERQDQTPESRKKVAELQFRITELKNKLKELEMSLPSSAGSFLRLCLGNIDVSLYQKKITDSIFHGILVWYYSTLTLQEHILIANGSRIKGWWVLHHYFSILLSGLLLIWPEGTIYQMFRGQFFVFSCYLSFVQLIQYRYQSGVLYRLRALGVSYGMDVTLDGFHTWMFRGLGFVLPFLIFGYLFQLYNAYTLFVFFHHPSCLEWQVLALSITFFVLFFGNMTTLVYVMRSKYKQTHKIKFPCN
ncbi:transmembrane protein 120B-A isoform X2 [Nematostella vectensis]|uniref:transmembrane protein 120B-A isoform X2 n=1 Tax=Nematostella vectensis TaxID=45351 RepID=UPI001390579F|nr:transmembrane protein 120B-A isoform X2 [Nematostella vectensis]